MPDAGHDNNPFVLGMIFDSRRSREQAMRSALPNALKSASTWWCPERP
jgi:hypothetical protein